MKQIITRTVKSLTFTLALLAGQAAASVIVVNPGDPSWGTVDANSEITDTFARSGNGSLELRGDRTRFFGLGNPFDINSNIGLLSNLIDFSFEWAIAASSISNLHPDYTPALRLHIFDGQQRSELIWEGAYNGTYGNTTRDTWYQSAFGDNFWQFVSGVGVTEIYNRTINDWKSIYSSSAYIAAISVGVGSSVGANYLSFADNVTLQFVDQMAMTFNFEPEATTNVPAPGALSVMFATLALVTLGRLRCRR